MTLTKSPVPVIWKKLESTIAFIDHLENMLHLTELHSVCSYCPVRHTLKNKCDPHYILPRTNI